MTGRPRNTAASFWKHVNRGEPNECWPWIGGLRNGYGHHSENYLSQYAHRRAWEIANGREAPKGRHLHVLHSCNNKVCCNPNHLSIGTAAKNTQDAYKDGLAAAGERHWKTVLSSEAVSEIRVDPRSQTKLAEIYGVSQTHISNIKANKTRKHDGDPS